MSFCTGAKNAFSPSSVVEYARLPTKTCEGEGKIDEYATSNRALGYLEARLCSRSLLRNRRHAVLIDRGGGGVRHWRERGTGDFLLRDELVVNRFLRVKLEG